MRRVKFAVAVAAVWTYLMAGDDAHALTVESKWIAPQVLASRLWRFDVRSVNRTYRTDGSGAPLDGPIERGQIVSFVSLDGLHSIAPSLIRGTWVMYDIERWSHTPKSEQAKPFRSMQRFVDAARSYGFVAVLAPGREWRDRGANQEADVFLAQVQKLLDPAKYRAKVCELARRFDGPLYAELTANGEPGHDVAGLMRQWRAGRLCTSRFALWGKTDPSNVGILRQFLDRATT